MALRGRPKTSPAAVCPDPAHKGSHVAANGTRTTATGTRRRYRCEPTAGDAHTFTVVLTETGDAAMRNLSPPPPCPRGHTGTATRSGTYGTRVAEKRQLYRCVPDDEAFRPHDFAAMLPRDHIHRGNEDCVECRELRGIHRGEEAAARRHTWSARVVARGLDRIAAGETYASVSKWALRVAGSEKRQRKNSKKQYRTTPQTSKDVWHIAADWVEAFSPLVWEEVVERLELRTQSARSAERPVVWLIDDTSIKKRPGRKKTREGFNLLVISEWVGDDADAAGQLRLVRALPTRTTDAWKLVLDEPGYAPDIVISDAAETQLGAVRDLFPQARIVPCLWHVTNNVRKALVDVPGACATSASGSKRLHKDIETHLYQLRRSTGVLDSAANVTTWFDTLETLHIEHQLPLDKMTLQRNYYEPQLVQALPTIAAYPEMPTTTAAAEVAIRHTLKPAISQRKAGLGNIERTNRLLDLIVARGHKSFDDLNTVAAMLRADAMTDGGHSTPLRHVADPKPLRGRYSSLRDATLVSELVKDRGLQ